MGRHDLMLELGRSSEPWKSRKTEEIRNKIRRENGVPLPKDADMHGCILKEMVRETGWKPEFRLGDGNYEKMLAYWRQNREKFPRPLTTREKIEKMERKKKEGWHDLQKMLRENVGRKDEDEKRKREERKKEEGWHDLQKWMREKRVREDNNEKRMSEIEQMQKRAVDAQMEAMKAVVADLPIDMANVVGDVPVGKGDADTKGKGIVIDGGGTSGGNVDDDDWGDDELLIDNDSD